MSRAVELAAAALETIRTTWSADSDFLARGSIISAPRVRHHQLAEGAELVDVQTGGIEFGEEITAAPQVNRLTWTLLVYGIVDAGVRNAPLYLGDPAAAELLDRLDPLAALLERKIEATLRALESSSDWLIKWQFAEFTPLVAADGGRLRGAARFRYVVDMLVAAYVGDEAMVDLEGGDMDYELDQGEAPTPHAEDEVTF